MWGCVLQTPVLLGTLVWAPSCAVSAAGTPLGSLPPFQSLSSVDGFELLYVYNFPNSITSSHLPGPACITRTIWGKLPRRFCYFVFKTSPPTSLALTGVVATSSFPVFPRSLAKILRDLLLLSLQANQQTTFAETTSTDSCMFHKQ